MATAKQVFEHWGVNPDTWKLHEHIRIRISCCRSGEGEGLGDIASLRAVLNNVDYKDLIALHGTIGVTTPSGPLWTDEEANECEKNLTTYIEGLLFLLYK